jgi:hypothetical protein
MAPIGFGTVDHEHRSDPEDASTFYDNTNGLLLMDQQSDTKTSQTTTTTDHDYEIFEDNENNDDDDDDDDGSSTMQQNGELNKMDDCMLDDEGKIKIDISISRSTYSHGASVGVMHKSPSTDKASSTTINKPQYQQNQARNTRKLSKLDRKGRYMTDPLARQHINEHVTKLPKRNSLNDKFQSSLHHDENSALSKQVHGDSTSTILSTDSGVSSTTYGNQSRNSLESIIKLTDMKLSEEEADDIFKNFVNNSTLNNKKASKKVVLKFDARNKLNACNSGDGAEGGGIKRIDESKPNDNHVFNCFKQDKTQSDADDDDDDAKNDVVENNLVMRRNTNDMYDFNNNNSSACRKDVDPTSMAPYKHTHCDRLMTTNPFYDHDFASRFYTNNDGKPLVVNLENRTLKIRSTPHKQHQQPLVDCFYANFAAESIADKEIEILTAKIPNSNMHHHHHRHHYQQQQQQQHTRKFTEKRSATPVDYLVSPVDIKPNYDESIRSANAKSLRQDTHQRFMLVSLLHTTQDAT